MGLTLLAAVVPLLAGKGRAMHDYFSATKVVSASAWRPPNIQLLAERGSDPTVRRQVLGVLVLMVAWCVACWFAAGRLGI